MRRRRGMQGERNRERVGAQELCFICIAHCESVKAGDALVGKPAFMLHSISQLIRERTSNLLPPREQRNLKNFHFSFLRKAFPVEHFFFSSSVRRASTSSIARERGFVNALSPAFTWYEKTIYRDNLDLFRRDRSPLRTADRRTFYNFVCVSDTRSVTHVR